MNFQLEKVNIIDIKVFLFEIVYENFSFLKHSTLKEPAHATISRVMNDAHFWKESVAYSQKLA